MRTRRCPIGQDYAAAKDAGKRAEGGKVELKSESFDFGLQISD
jgi:hypothetical protein